MFFLLRSAFWLGLVFIFLPTPGDPRGETGSRIVREARDAAVDSAGQMAADAGRLCLERTQACLEAAALLSGRSGADTLAAADRAAPWRAPAR